MGRLDATHQAEAEVRQAFQRDDSRAEALLPAAHVDGAAGPGLMLDHVRYLRRAGR